MISKKLKKRIRIIKNFPKKGILFQDITSITDDNKLFSEVINEIVKYAKKNKITKIAGIEARGFIFGSASAVKLNIPFIPIRKKNKLPAETHSVDFELEYGKATIEVHKDSIEKGEKILIIDDLIATGGTADAAAKLIEMSGGKVAGFIFVINLFDLGGNENLIKKKYNTESLIEFPGH